MPAVLSLLIMKLLEKDPAQRPASAGEVAEILRQLQPDAAGYPTAPTFVESNLWAKLQKESTAIASAAQAVLRSLGPPLHSIRVALVFHRGRGWLQPGAL